MNNNYEGNEPEIDNIDTEGQTQETGKPAAGKKKKVILSVVGAIVVVVIVIGTILTITHFSKGNQSETPDPTPSIQVEQVEPTMPQEELDDTLDEIDDIMNSGVVDIEEISPDGTILGKDKDGNQVLEVLPDQDSEEFKKALAEADAMLDAALKGEPITPTPSTEQPTPSPDPKPVTPPPAQKPVTPPPETTDSGSVGTHPELTDPDNPYKDNTFEDIVIAPGTGTTAPADSNSPADGLYWD